MLDWLFILIAAVLYGASFHTKSDKYPAAPVGLNVASLVFFVAGMYKLFSKNKEEPCSSGKPSRSANFNDFKKLADEDESPWCIGTYYAIAYKVGDVTSEVGPITNEIKSSTHTQPMFTLTAPASGAAVQWYRAVEGVNGGQLRPHEMDTSTVNGVTYFIDIDNPCKEPFVPDPPRAPTVGGGQFGDDKQWEIEARQGITSWCTPTVYYATYAKAGSNESALSEPSIPFSSTEFSNPCLSVSAPRAGYDVNWYRQVLQVANITLPLFYLGGQWIPGGAVLFSFAVMPILVGLPSTRDTLNFGDLWEEGSPTLTLPVSLFVQRWNNVLPARVPGVERAGELSMLSDGKLAMTGIRTANLNDHVEMTVAEASRPWWVAMGFSADPKKLITNRGLVAETLPVSNLRTDKNSSSDEIELIGKGIQLIDRENPCPF